MIIAMEYEYEHITAEENVIEKIAENLTYKQQGIFLLMTTERMFQVYKKYAKGQEWDRTEKLNAFLEDCWDAMINDMEFDYITDRIKPILDESEDQDKFLYECMDDCPQYIMEIDEENDEIPDYMEILSDIVIYIHKLLRQTAVISILKKNDNIEKELVVGIFNFPFLEKFLCYYSPQILEAKENGIDDLFNQHELVKLEFEREKRDIEYLKNEKNMQNIYKKYHYDLQENILGEYWFHSDNQKTGEQPFEECEEEKNTPEYYFKYACKGDETGNYEDAIVLYGAVIAFQPDNVEAYNRRGIDFMRLGQFEQAISDFNKVIELNPNDARAHSSLGAIYTYFQDYKKAFPYYSKAIEVDPDEEANYHNLGVMYNKLKNYKKAIPYFEKALALNSNFEVSYFNRADSYIALKQYQKAIEDLDKAIALKPDYIDAYINRAEIYDKLKEYQKAIEDFSKVIALCTDIIGVYCKRGDIYFKQKEYQKAISDYSKEIEINPNDKEVYLSRAKAYRAIGEKEKAVADKTTAKKL